MTLLSECYHTGFQSSDFIKRTSKAKDLFCGIWSHSLKLTGNIVSFFQPRMNLWPVTRQAQLSLLDGRYLERWTASNLLAQQSKTCKNAETFATWLTNKRKEVL